MAKERSEEEKVLQLPVMVVFGGKKHEIKPLPLKLAVPWVKEVAEMLVGTVSLAGVSSDNSKEFGVALSDLLIKSPEKVVNLFFQYAKDLNREEIEGTATTSELITAFEEVMKLERPFLFARARLIELAMVEPEQSSSSLSPRGTSPRER